MVKKPFEVQITAQCAVKGFSIIALRRAVQKILREMQWEEAALTIMLINDRQMRRINKKHLSHDWPTDVITFGYITEDGPQPLLAGKPFLGDVVISLTTARRQAAEYGNGFFYEVCFYVCHALLHIAGFDDATRRQRDRMLKIQEDILKSAGIKKESQERK